MDQNIQQAKSNPKGKAVASLIFGIIGIIPSLLLLFLPFLPNEAAIFIMLGMALILSKGLKLECWGEMCRGLAGVGIILIIIFSLMFGLIGLFLGIKGLKSTKRNLAIAGIVLSGINIFSLIITPVIWLIFS